MFQTSGLQFDAGGGTSSSSMYEYKRDKRARLDAPGHGDLTRGVSGGAGVLEDLERIV